MKVLTLEVDVTGASEVEDTHNMRFALRDARGVRYALTVPDTSLPSGLLFDVLGMGATTEAEIVLKIRRTERAK